jgi:GT2 family glycosyltransferase
VTVLPQVAAVVITHGPHPDLAACLAALRPQVDDLVVVANLPGPLGELPPGTRVVENPSPIGFAANANRGVAATTAPYIVIANPDAVAVPHAVPTLAAFLHAHPNAGVAGPEMRYPDGSWQPTRRRFPTVLGTLVRRTPLRLVLRGQRWHAAHYNLHDRPDVPTEADWLLGGFLCLRRSMLDALGGFDEGYRLYCEDIDLGYTAHKAGWERWYVPEAVVVHRYAAEIDKRFLTTRNWWHLLGMVRFVRKHPERALAIR